MSPADRERYSVTRAAPEESALAARFRERIRLFAARRVRDAALAEDVAQETLRRVLAALREGRVENLDALPSFVFQTARHICLQHHRSRGREARALAGLERDAEGAPAAADALAALVGEEQRLAVRRALDALDEPDRTLLGMLYYEQVETAEAAGRLGITPGALRVRKHRALLRLSRELGAGAPGAVKHFTPNGNT
jgi:RNA polymerase sigma-70 factor (ECF subfamily)